MAKVRAVDLGDYEVKAVELDGSFRKTRLTKVGLAHVGSAGLQAEALADAARLALDDGKIGRNELTAAQHAREVVLRTIDVPFLGRDSIRRVVKSEVEGEIHSHNVDDMIVDFHVIAEDGEESKVLVAAAPKGSLRVQLDALESRGIEPDIYDLDAMALYRAAIWCGAFEPGGQSGVPAVVDGDEDGEALELPALSGAELHQQSTFHVVLDFGARSTLALLVRNGHLTDMRVLRTGHEHVVDEIADSLGRTPREVRAGAMQALETGEDAEGGTWVVADGESAFDEAEAEARETDEEVGVAEVALPDLEDQDAEEDAEPEVSKDRQFIVPFAAVNEAHEKHLKRIERELTRFLTSVPGMTSVAGLTVTGGGCNQVGLFEVLTRVFETEPVLLDVMGRINHSFSEEEADLMNPRLAVAIGLGLGRLGSPVPSFDFRTEDLSFTRGFDRIKFPLAIACMMAFFLSIVFAAKKFKEVGRLENEYGQAFTAVEEAKMGSDGIPKEGWQYYGMVGTLINQNAWFWDNRNVKNPRQLSEDLLQEDTFGRVGYLRGWLKDRVDELERESGIYSDSKLESGLAVLNRFASVQEGIESELGRYLVSEINLNMPFAASDGRRSLKVTYVLRNPGMRGKQTVIERAFTADIARPDSPFASYGTTKETMIEDGEAQRFEVNLVLRDEFEPFGGSGPSRVGTVRRPVEQQAPKVASNQGQNLDIQVAANEGNR